jgi:hypothetical protein
VVIDRILSEIAVGTEIPKPSAKGKFRLRGEGEVRGERGIRYSIPRTGRPDGQKGVTAKQLEAAFDQLQRSGELTRDWWNENVRHAENEGGCNFTTVGGLFKLLGEAEYLGRGVFGKRG